MLFLSCPVPSHITVKYNYSQIQYYQQTPHLEKGSKTMYQSNKCREEELVEELSIPKTTSLYTKREIRGGNDDTPEPNLTGRKNSKAEQFRMANSLTLKRSVNAAPVEFLDGKTGNKLRFSPAKGAGRGISYHVNNSPRADIGTIVYDERGPMLRFVDIYKGCNLPSQSQSHPQLLESLKKLADETGVWNNIPKGTVSDKVVFKLHQSESEIVFCQSVSKPNKLKVLDSGGCYYVSGLTVKTSETDVSKMTISCQQGTQWNVKSDSCFASNVKKLRGLCDQLKIPHKLTRNCVVETGDDTVGKIWITSETRKFIKILAVSTARNNNISGLPKFLVREITKWCGVTDPPLKKAHSLHVLVVLWGYSETVESRHVRCSRGSATPVHIHKKLTSDKHWHDARISTASWNAQAVYWLGESDITLSSFKPTPLLPSVPLVSQGFQPASGHALHIVHTEDANRLAFFRKMASHNGKTSDSRKGKKKNCLIM